MADENRQNNIILFPTNIPFISVIYLRITQCLQLLPLVTNTYLHPGLDEWGE